MAETELVSRVRYRTLAKLKVGRCLADRRNEQNYSTLAVSSGCHLYLFPPSNQIHTTTHHLTSTCETSGEMGFLGLNKRSADVHSPTSTHQDVEKADQQHQQPTITSDKYDSDTTSDTLSLEARNQREIEQHPDQVTADAQAGIRKAEAVALVWPKNATYLTYAWYESTALPTSLPVTIHLHSPQDMAVFLPAGFPVCRPVLCIRKCLLQLQPGAGVRHCRDPR
jgi:hypothetical protein